MRVGCRHVNYSEKESIIVLPDLSVIISCAGYIKREDVNSSNC